MDQVMANVEQDKKCDDLGEMIDDLQTTLFKAEKVRKGFQLPDTVCFYDNTLDNALN